MYDVNELWNSAWLKMQKNLASGFGIERAGEAHSTRGNEVDGRAIAASSWLVRARSRKLQVARVIQ